jgi:hypothetical protein
MGKRKKQNELDAILEQLKKSYGADVDAQLEDSLLESDDADKDDELSSVLERIFLENDVSDYAQNDEDNDDQSVSELKDEAVATVRRDEINQNNEVEKSDGVEESLTVSEKAFESDTNSNSDEEQRVDDILSKMFPATSTSSTVSSAADTYGKDPRPNALAQVLSDREDIACESGFMSYEEEEIIPDDIMEEIISEQEEIVPGQMTIDQLIESFRMEDAPKDSDTDNEIDIEMSEYEESAEFYDDFEDILCEELEETEELFVPRLILNAEEYQFDPLQQTLNEMAFFKPQSDIDYEEPTVVEYEKAQQDTSVSNTLDNNDISLLLKFGYDEEVKTQVGNEKTQRIRFDKDVSGIPKSHRNPYGFCGKEISDRTQMKKISNKYKSDKKTLTVSAVIISIIVLIFVGFTVAFYASSDKGIAYPVMLLLEFVAVAVTSMILGKKLISGILSITRFEADIYSALAYIVGEYFLYNIVTLVIYAANPALFDGISLMSFGSIVLIYAAVTVFCELADCSRELAVFDIMASKDSFYTVEKQTTPDVHVSDHGRRIVSDQSQNNTYKVMKTGLISGYFKKTAGRHSANINLVYIFGVVPVFAMLVGCFAAIAGENIIYGIYSMTMSSLLCIPMSYIFIAPFVEYIVSVKLKKNNAASVGYGAEEGYNSVSALVFSDSDAIEITSYTEINPNKVSSDARKWIDISCEVFKALGGPLGKIYYDKQENVQSSFDGDLIINSISENGVDIYFNSSMNILMGDRQYMLARGIKVKTDTNLTTAVKGAEKSVIYVAFDGQPQVAFIVNSKIKSDFVDTVSTLNTSDIRVLVSSYEPQINDMYFEHNKMNAATMISTVKPSTYEHSGCRRICDGSVIAHSIGGIASAIAESGNIVSDRKKAAKINTAVMIMGFIWSLFLAFFMSIGIEWAIIDVIKDHIVTAFYAFMAVSLVPAVIYMLKILQKNKP